MMAQNRRKRETFKLFCALQKNTVGSQEHQTKTCSQASGCVRLELGTAMAIWKFDVVMVHD